MIATPPLPMVHAGPRTTFYIDASGDLWATGVNEHGQLGVGHCDNTDRFHRCGLTDVVDVAAGDSHTLAVTRDGRLWAAGSNEFGELGLGELDDTPTTTFTEVPVTAPIRAVAAGHRHSVALTEHHKVLTCGYGDDGQLGLGYTDFDLDPLDVIDAAEFNEVPDIEATRIFAGGSSSGMLDDLGYLWVCGDNAHGQLGLGGHRDHSVFDRVTGRRFTDVAMAAQTTIAVDIDGAAWVAGSSQYATLSGSFRQISELTSGVTHVAAGAGLMVAVAGDDNQLWTARCGQLTFSASITGRRERFLPLDGFQSRSVAVGDHHLATTVGDQLQVLGTGSDGQLGCGPSDAPYGATVDVGTRRAELAAELASPGMTIGDAYLLADAALTTA